MEEIYNFKVTNAHAQIVDGKMTVRISYPKDPEILTKRLPEDLEFGVSVFERLIALGYSNIAYENHPIKPASAGSLYVLKDGKIVCHRRDRFAPSHKLYHSAYAGYTQSREFVYTAEGLKQTALRESAEECLLVTRDKKPRLVVPNDSKDYTLEAAKNIGLELEPLFVDVETLEPTDTLIVFDEDNNLIFEAKAFLEFIYESQTSLNALQLRSFPFSSEEVLPVDAEGMMRDGKFVHFNRESYVLDPKDIARKPFGTRMQDPQVFQTRIENGIPLVFRPEYKEPYLGPDKIEVNNPHIWAPEDLLCRTLDALGVEGYKGRWMYLEWLKESMKLQGKSLLPEDVLK